MTIQHRNKRVFPGVVLPILCTIVWKVVVVGHARASDSNVLLADDEDQLLPSCFLQ